MRKVLLPSLIIIATSLLVLRLFYLQVVNDTFKLKSDNNAIKIKYDYPERGYIYDRNGKLLVANQPSYDIMVIPREIKEMDTLHFCSLLNITKTEFIANMSSILSSTLLILFVIVTYLNLFKASQFVMKRIFNFKEYINKKNRTTLKLLKDKFMTLTESESKKFYFI